MASSVPLQQPGYLSPSSLVPLSSHGEALSAKKAFFFVGRSHGSRQAMILAGSVERCKGRSSTYRTKRSVVQVRNGLPIVSSVPVLGPILNTLFSPLVLLAAYAIGATKFFSGFSRTTYADSLPTKVGLTLAWPVLFLASQKYRSNFKRAVQ